MIRKFKIEISYLAWKSNKIGLKGKFSRFLGDRALYCDNKDLSYLLPRRVLYAASCSCSVMNVCRLKVLLLLCVHSEGIRFVVLSHWWQSINDVIYYVRIDARIPFVAIKRDSLISLVG